MLRTAMRRTLDAINAIVEVEHEGRTPTLRAGSSCRWCALRSTCHVGIAHLAPTDE